MVKKTLIFILLLLLILNGCVEVNLVKDRKLQTEKIWLGDIGKTGYYEFEPIRSKPELVWYYNNPPYPLENNPILYQPVFINSPIFYNDTVYFSDRDGNFYAIDSKNGKLKWKVSFDKKITTPTISDGVIFIGVIGEGIFGLNSENGEIIFKLYNNCLWFSPPVIIDSILYFVSIKPGWQHLKVYINSFNIRKGRYIFVKKFNTNHPNAVFRVSFNKNSIIFHNNYIKRILYCFDIKNGRLKWKKEGLNILNIVIPVCSDALYITSLENDKVFLLSLNMENGEEILKREIVNTNKEIEDILLVVGNEDIYVGIFDSIYKINKNDGKIKWNIKVGKKIGKFMQLVKDILYVNVEDIEGLNSLYGIDSYNGEIIWKLKGYSLFDYPPDISDHSLYVLGYSSVYKLSD
ncbi:MAG TPA: PQQ-binding-like beta-propeller repeat protein [Caldisericia bacterium]|nr:PQQ-binding-like beta-propeller repeat protein [Caldisericia bacterium]HPB34150.1 PQQ-binding-like beta-propeller repeat protein [Caldisericia bacterium]HQL65972.1 PQQ-binding-like beta-propeller repeat protein [Caldisericia bacterium]HQN48531.1 PQQ-binding-like beta-propeller repeat protein [Caldisericia bacterium]HQO99660.1 PQQ-binding-like beta-propeller repeat protein [Caldisericia bacterium]